MPEPDVATYAVGLDLAWGERARTGAAALDARGRLLDVTSLLTDDEVVAWTSRWSPGLTVGFDAPLVVRNPTGQRRCERLVNRHFARYAAGAHPTNLGRPAFADGGRAHRLAARLDLRVDPSARGAGTAHEVYPHPATVVLFGLDRRIPYKAKQGRTVEDRLAAFEVLLDGLESLADDPVPLDLDVAAWHGLTARVRSASRQVDLDRAEDPVDAVLCAYVVRLAESDPARVRVLGDDDGAIVVPVTSRLGAAIDADAAAGTD